MSHRSNHQPRVLLWNPPGKKRYLRDGYCSQVSKGPYLWPPLDLLVQSARLKEHAQVSLVDSVATSQVPSVNDYDVVLVLTGWVSLAEDVLLVQQLKEQFPKVTWVAVGDIFRFEPHLFLEYFPQFDFALSDYAGTALVDFIEGRPAQWQKLEGALDYGVPHDMDHAAYRLPIPGFGKLGMVLTSDGCPFRCRYCNLSHAPLRRRPLHLVEEELRSLSNRGVHNILMRDPTLNYHKGAFQQFLSMLQRLRRDGHHFRMTAFLRADLLEREEIRQMAEVGVTAALLGIESGDPALLATEYDRKSQHQRLKENIQQLRQHGILSIGLYISGLEGKTSQQDMLQTMNWFGTDLASANDLILRIGTPLFQDFCQKHQKNALQIWQQYQGDFLHPDGTPSKQQRLAVPLQIFRSYHANPIRAFQLFRWSLKHGSLLDLAGLALKLPFTR